MPVGRRAREADRPGHGLDRRVRRLQQRQARAHALLEQPAARASSPVARRKRRVNVRTLMYARPASASRSSGSSRRSSAHAITLAIGSSSGCAGIGSSISCAWPPSRWGGITSRRATALATLLPWSRRTMCRQRSIPAALPADVSTLPAST